MSRIALVVIGRNEGQRLRVCLESVCHRGFPVVYVDSGSTDGSVEVARSLGAEVVELEMTAPLTAARGRNAGFAQLMQHVPPPEFVQFVDGDCEIAEGWLTQAARALSQSERCAIVCGRLRERHPEASLFHRCCDVEWSRPSGETDWVGGVFMVRSAAFRQVGGFDVTVAAGEEPELCQRLRDRGWQLQRLRRDMALHDAAILRFGDWWHREIRNGRGMLDVATRFDGIVPFRQGVRSARIWGVAWPLLVIASGGVAVLLGGWKAGVGAAAIVALAVPLQILRIAIQTIRNGHRAGVALTYGWLTMLGKCAQLVGHWQHYRRRVNSAPWKRTYTAAGIGTTREREDAVPLGGRSGERG